METGSLEASIVSECDDCLPEVYLNISQMHMVKTLLFISEYPLAWTGVYVIEALPRSPF